MSISTNTEFSELTTLGIEFYKKHLKNLLEPQHNGEFVAIEPYSGRYFVNNNGTNVLITAREEMPKSKFYLARIGHNTTDRLRNYGNC